MSLAVGLALGASMHGGGSMGAPDQTDAIAILIGLTLAALCTLIYYPRIKRAADDRVELCFFTVGFYLIAILAELVLAGVIALIGIALGLT